MDKSGYWDSLYEILYEILERKWCFFTRKNGAIGLSPVYLFMLSLA